MSPEALWSRVRHCFESNDGSLPAVELQSLEPDEVATVYRKVRASGKLRGAPSFWDRETSSDRLLDAVPNAALLVTEGRAAAFHFVMEEFTTSEVVLPYLGFQVFQSLVAVDYRMGSEWNAQRVFGFLQWLRALLEATRSGKLDLATDGPPDPAAFLTAWEDFR
jgi:hypothetical protein